MSLSRKIALRYLFSKKSHSIINAVSLVSVCGVAVTTMAIICVLSVYNGFTDLIGSLYSQVDPQIKVTPVEGKAFDASADVWRTISGWREVNALSPVIEETALAVYADRQRPVLVKGVPEEYDEISDFPQTIVRGDYRLNDPYTAHISLSVGVAAQMECGLYSVTRFELYAPKRKGRVNLAAPMNSFNKQEYLVSSIFAVNQAAYDDQYVFVPLASARQLFDYTTEATAMEIELMPDANEAAVIDRLRSVLGDGYRVADRLHQQNDWYHWVQIEKWITFLILAFILMIATFNVIGALSILIVDKQQDIATLRCLGADDRLVSRIFLLEGWLISAVGAGTGLVIGVLLCLLQQEFGFIRLGDGSDAFIVDAYPVKLALGDVACTLLVVLIMGALTAWYPAKYLRRKLLKEKT